MAELLTQSRLDRDGGTVPLPGDELKSLWSNLRQRYPKDFGLNPAEWMRWHRTNALQCEQEWDWWGAQFHLSRLAPLQPHDTHVRARLSYARQALALVEAQTESWSDRVKVIRPPRPPRATVHHLDLTRSTNPHRLTHYLRSVKEDFWSGGPGPNHIGQLPSGIQSLAGVEWDIRCYVRLGRNPQPTPSRHSSRVHQTSGC